MCELSENELNNAIFDKYIKPTQKPRSPAVGVEIEMPVVNLSGKPVDEAAVLEMSQAFCTRFGFEPVGSDDDGNVNSMSDSKTEDNLSFDCCYSNLELSMGKSDSLFDIKKRFDEYYTFINDHFRDRGYTLTGMGINPHCNINHNKPVPNERYRMLYHYLHSYKKYDNSGSRFHDRPDFGTFTSASQVQLDVQSDSLIDAINAFNLLEPYKAMLFANSYMPEFPKLLCARNMLWERSMQGYNPHNVGLFRCRLGSIDELVEYINTQSIYCVMRDGKYIDFAPIPVSKYFRRDSVSGEYFDGDKYRQVSFSPRREDLEYLRTFKFVDLTYRGTIEFRSSCTQPIKDSMTVAAFHTGLMEKLPALKNKLEKDSTIYSHGYCADELQRLFSCREYPAFADKKRLSLALGEILDLAAEGLKKRGQGEEAFLKPLYQRAERLTDPARELVNGLEKGETLERYIAEYSRL